MQSVSRILDPGDHLRSTAGGGLLAEGVVIVVSILFAFSLNALWDYRNALENEEALLQSLAGEFRANHGRLAATIAEVDTDQSHIAAFVDMSPPDAGALPGDPAWRQLSATWKPNAYELASGVLNSALGSGQLVLIRDQQLRAMVAGWPGRVDDIRERAAVMIRQEANVQGAVDRVAASLGVEVLGPATAPDLLEAVRTDPVAIATIARKRFQADIYVMQLTELMAVLDSIVGALSGS